MATIQTHPWDVAEHLEIKEDIAAFDGDIVTVEKDRYSHGEQRFVTFGLLQGRGIAVPQSYL